MNISIRLSGKRRLFLPLNRPEHHPDRSGYVEIQSLGKGFKLRFKPSQLNQALFNIKEAGLLDELSGPIIIPRVEAQPVLQKQRVFRTHTSGWQAGQRSWVHMCNPQFEESGQSPIPQQTCRPYRCVRLCHFRQWLLDRFYSSTALREFPVRSEVENLRRSNIVRWMFARCDQ